MPCACAMPTPKVGSRVAWPPVHLAARKLPLLSWATPATWPRLLIAYAWLERPAEPRSVTDVPLHTTAWEYPSLVSDVPRIWPALLIAVAPVLVPPSELSALESY